MPAAETTIQWHIESKEIIKELQIENAADKMEGTWEMTKSYAH